MITIPAVDVQNGSNIVSTDIRRALGLDGSGSDALFDNNYQSMLNNLYDKAKSGDEAAYEKLWNYYASEESSKTARDWTAQREDTAYQRLMADLKKAGISPYIMSSATPAVSSSSGNSYSGSQMVSRINNEKSQETDIISKIIGTIGTALMAMAIFGKALV